MYWLGRRVAATSPPTTGPHPCDSGAATTPANCASQSWGPLSYGVQQGTWVRIQQNSLRIPRQSRPSWHPTTQAPGGMDRAPDHIMVDQGVSCIPRRPPYAHLISINQQPFCRPSGLTKQKVKSSTLRLPTKHVPAATLFIDYGTRLKVEDVIRILFGYDSIRLTRLLLTAPLSSSVWLRLQIFIQPPAC